MSGPIVSANPDSPAAVALARIAAAPADRPFVVAQLGQSLDGRIATLSGESRYISGLAALDHLHRLRAHVQAVVVGAGTVAADNPRLNVRRTTGSNPARVILDPHGRLGPGALWLADDGARKIMITSGARPGCGGCEHIVVPLEGGRMPPQKIVEALFSRGFSRLLIEGGADTISRFIEEDALDRLHLMVACVIMGSGRAGLDLKPLARLSDARRPETDIYRLGPDDVLFDCAMRG